MMQIGRPVPQRRVVELANPLPRGIDATNDDAGMIPGFVRDLTNVHIIGNSLNDNGSTIGGPVTKDSGVVAITASLQYGGKRWAFWATPSVVLASFNIRVCELKDTPVDTVDWVYSGAPKKDFYKLSRIIVHRDGLIAWSANLSTPPQKVEYSTSLSKWTSRTLGMDNPGIKNMAYGTAVASFQGQYRYGVELVLKDTTTQAVIRSTGICRLDASGNMFPVIDPGGKAMVVNVWDFSDTYVSHIRLWRTKNLIPDTTENGLIRGSDGVMYCVQEMTYSEFKATVAGGFGQFSEDATLDSSLPVIALEPIPTTPEILDLKPITGFSCFGSVSGTKLWVGNSADDPSGIYPSAGQYGSRYEEQYSPADRNGAIGSGSIIALNDFEGDLIAQCQGGAWRYPGAVKDSQPILIGDRSGVASPDRVGSFSGFGYVILGDDRELKYFDRSMAWRDDLGGKNVSDSIHHLFKNDGLYASKTFMLARSGECLVMGFAGVGTGTIYVLHPGQGWVSRKYFFGGDDFIVGIFDSGTDEPWVLRKLSSPDGSGYTYYLNRHNHLGTGDHPAVIMVGPFQASNLGQGIIEMLELRITGVTKPTEVRVSDATSSASFNRALEVAENYPSSGQFSESPIQVRTWTYRVPLDQDTPQRAIAERLFFQITMFGDFSLDRVVVKAAVQDGGLTMDRNLAYQENLNLASQVEFFSSLQQRYTRNVDPTQSIVDYFGAGLLTEV